MVQILWKSNAPHSPRQDHDLVELRLVDLGRRGKSRFLVREVHATWSASTQQIEWKGYRDATYGTAREAQRCFETLRASFLATGYPFTTVLA